MKGENMTKYLLGLDSDTGEWEVYAAQKDRFGVHQVYLIRKCQTFERAMTFICERSLEERQVDNAG